MWFPGGGTHFKHGAPEYIQRLGNMTTNSTGDLRSAGVAQVLDVGCGVASFAAYLFPLDIQTISFAPLAGHENQIQFALERGIPAIIGVLGTKRLPYPSRSFDAIHCESRCRVDWHEEDRLLRPGGFFIYSAPRNKPLDNCIGLTAEADSSKISRLPPWPARLTTYSKIFAGAGLKSAAEFDADTSAWDRKIREYWQMIQLPGDDDSVRNIMDMNAGYGGFAAALALHGKPPVWVMTVVPSEFKNTLGVVYGRGLIGPGLRGSPATLGATICFTLMGCGIADLMLDITTRSPSPSGIVARLRNHLSDELAG